MNAIRMAYPTLKGCLKLANNTSLARFGRFCLFCNRAYAVASLPQTKSLFCMKPCQKLFSNRTFTSEVIVPFASRHEVIKDVNQEIKSDTGRVFAVVLIGGSQFKVTAEDLIQFTGHIEADVGERIRLEKVLLVGGDNFTVIGKPLLSSTMVRVEATIIEKTLSEKKILFRFRRRKNYKKYKEMWAPLTVLRINTIEVNPVLS